MPIIERICAHDKIQCMLFPASFKNSAGDKLVDSDGIFLISVAAVAVVGMPFFSHFSSSSLSSALA